MEWPWPLLIKFEAVLVSTLINETTTFLLCLIDSDTPRFTHANYSHALNFSGPGDTKKGHPIWVGPFCTINLFFCMIFFFFLEYVTQKILAK